MNKRKRNSAHDNPIIAAVQRSLQCSPLYPIPRSWESLPELLDAILKSDFDEDAIREVGRLVCLALLTGDRQIIKTVKDALKQSDHLFNRDRETALAADVMTYLPGLYLKLGPDGIVAIKKEIEKRSNHGKPLPQYRWNRLRRVFDLPKLPTGAAAVGRSKSGTKR